MNGASLLNWAAWAISILIFAWLVYDFYRVEKNYDEDFLLGKTNEGLMLEWEKGESK